MINACFKSISIIIYFPIFEIFVIFLFLSNLFRVRWVEFSTFVFLSTQKSSIVLEIMLGFNIFIVVNTSGNSGIIYYFLSTIVYLISVLFLLLQTIVNMAASPLAMFIFVMVFWPRRFKGPFQFKLSGADVA